MSAIAGTAALEQRLERLTPPLAVVLPGGRRIGSRDAAVTVRMNDLAAVTHLVTGRIGKVGEDYVEGRIDIDGNMRDVMALAAELMAGDPTQVDVVAVAPPVTWLRQLVQLARSRSRHKPEVDAETLLEATDRFALRSGRLIERTTAPQCSRGVPIGRVFTFRERADTSART